MGSVDRKELLVRSSFANMKAFIILALAAVYAKAEAEAEADPAVLYAGHYGGYYGGYPYGLGYGYGLGGYYGYPGYYGFPGHNAVGAPALKPAPCARRKREAEADPAVLSSGYYGAYAGY